MPKSETPPAWAVSVESRGRQEPRQWRHVRAYGGEVDLAAAFHRPEGVSATLYTQVRTRRRGKAELRVGCDGDVEVSLDGRSVAVTKDGDECVGLLELAGSNHDLLLRVGTEQPVRTVAAKLATGDEVSYSCARPPGTEPPAHISGVFLFWRDRLAEEDQTQWERRFEFLRGLGMDTLIVQFSVVEGTAFYPSRHLHAAAPEGVDPTGRLLAAAAQSGFSVHLGVASDESNWWDIPNRPADLPKYVEKEPERNNRIARELIELYRDSPALAGIYLSHEIHLGDEWGGENMPHLVEIFNRMSDEVQRLAPELAVSTAPFFSLRGTIEQYEDRWRRFLEQTRLDILMLQDGVGCERNITVDNMVPYYEALARACNDTGVDFWTDLELFDLQRPEAVTAERLRTQLSLEAQYVRKVVAYSLGNLTPELVAVLPARGRA
ncbi:MAG: DUF4434 domain-containing protein [Armatimonadetes bacterium]|nr:DUF4434 domain-containing protein [Armatimonadota bacterium]